MEFTFNGHTYLLTFNGKPVLKEDDVEISNKTLSVIRGYVNANNINMSFVNSNGNPKNTYSVVKEFLSLQSGNKTQRKITNTIKMNMVSKVNKLELNENSNLPGHHNKLFLVNCCSSKIKSELLDDKVFSLENLHFNNQLGAFRKEIINLLKGGAEIMRKKKNVYHQVINTFNFNKTAPAHKLYSEGRFYKPANSIAWSSDETSKVYIISALFGLVSAEDYLPLYDFAITDSVAGVKNYAKNFWKGKLDSVIDELGRANHTIINLMGEDYSSIINKSKTQKPNLVLSANDRSNALKLRGEWLKRQLEV